MLLWIWSLRYTVDQSYHLLLTNLLETLVFIHYSTGHFMSWFSTYCIYFWEMVPVVWMHENRICNEGDVLFYLFISLSDRHGRLNVTAASVLHHYYFYFLIGLRKYESVGEFAMDKMSILIGTLLHCFIFIYFHCNILEKYLYAVCYMQV